ncbi:MAG TPA: TylF/MycF/NovP-related O-methyltransferase [Nitrospira sp.]
MLSKLLEPVKALKNRWTMEKSVQDAGTGGPEDQDGETIKFVQPYTMTSPARIRALCSATRYVVDADIPGAIVECGVWRGGSMMAVARTLMRLGAQRDLYLFDTFEGMSEPGPQDVAMTGESAKRLLDLAQRTEDDAMWCYAPLERVRHAMSLTEYPVGRIHLVRGKVEDTLQTSAPSSIALLRLDTDWYESTRHEMEQLFPRLRKGGVLILDDYGHWQGAKRAVDEYLEKHQIKLLLHHIDYTGRCAVKVFETS